MTAAGLRTLATGSADRSRDDCQNNGWLHSISISRHGRKARLMFPSVVELMATRARGSLKSLTLRTFRLKFSKSTLKAIGMATTLPVSAADSHTLRSLCVVRDAEDSGCIRAIQVPILPHGLLPQSATSSRMGKW